MSNPFAAPNPPPEDSQERSGGPAPNPAPYGTPYPSAGPPGYGTPATHSPANPYGTPAGYGTPGAVGPPPPGYGYDYQAAPSTNGKAIASLVLGILGLVCFGFLTSIPAIVIGHSARREIQAGKGTGDGIALAGIVTGWVVTGLTIIGVLIVIGVLVFVPGAFDTAP